VQATTDGGENWLPQDSGTGERLRGVIAVSAERAWIVGENGAALTTSSGGVPAP
jgi:photosystem II stability/assembly factor-like uncharacterized protein